MPRPKQQQTKEKEIAPLPPVIRSSAGLRDALFDEMDRMRQNRTNATNANAMAKLASTIVDSVEMEISVRRFLNDLGTSDQEVGTDGRTLPSPIALGEAKRRNG